MVSYIDHFSNKECIFHDLPPSSRPCIFCHLVNWIKTFSESEMKCIIQQFSRIPQPSSKRRAFLAHFKIRERATKAYQLNKFIRFMTIFKNLHQSRNRIKLKPNPKRTEEAVKKVKNFVQKNPRTSLRKSSPEVSCTKTKLWRILRNEFGKKFYHFTSVQP